MSSPVPATSTSLNRKEPAQHQQADFQTGNYLPNPLQHDSYESVPLESTHTAEDVAAQHQHSASTPQASTSRGVLPYASSSSSSGASPNDFPLGDQPYYRRGSVDFNEAYGVTDAQARRRSNTMDTNTSRVPIYTPRSMPIHPGASVQMEPQNSARGRDNSMPSQADGSGGGEKGGSGMNTPSASNPGLLFAEKAVVGSPKKNAFARFVSAILNANFVVRWIIYIIPLLCLLWIPGIVGSTAYPNARVWGVPLVWWSAWLSVAWVGWWVSALVARMAPTVLRNTLGVVAPELRHYILYVGAIQYYIGATGWAVANWVSFAPLVKGRADDPNPSASSISLIIQGLFGIFIVLLILLIEKLAIQVIAHNFHKKSYEDRIDEQKFQIKVLTALYLKSHDTNHHDTTLEQPGARPKNRRQLSDPTLLVKKALRATKKAVQSTTTIIGTVASEIAGERVLQPNAPASVVLSALESANKSKALARRIYYSFVPAYRKEVLLEDISRCFENREVAERAFAVFDRDDNGDISLEELEMACLEIHRERLALTNSMRDMDSAVGRLDSIIMTVWYVIAIIIIVGLLDASFKTMITGVGTTVLGLSWLTGTTVQEILASVIFLFVKHVYDVGDRVDIDGVEYIVKEMQLLSSIFTRTDGVVVQAPHSVLNAKFVNNIRRSGAISEKFTWDVDFSTSLENIEALRTRMLEFLEVERRDFLPQIDISVTDFSGQGKLSLSADIKYKSNWQNGALKAQRRNKWICALRLAMSELQIFGPAGAGNPSPAPAGPTEYVRVPYVAPEQSKQEEAREKPDEKATKAEVLHSGEDNELADQTAVEQEEAGDYFYHGAKVN